MSLNYLVSDSLIRIKNGLSTKLFSVNLKYSKYILNIIKVLYTEGFILGYNIKRDLKNIKNKSIKAGIDPKITNRIWKTMIWSYISYQRSNFKKK